MSWRGAAAWVAAFAALVAIATQAIDDPALDPAQGPGRTDSSTSAARTAKVIRVVDGDTILVRGRGGAAERVRYIGVDTPETVKPNSPVECFSHEASRFNSSLVGGSISSA